MLLQGLLPEKKIFEVHIEKGHKHNAKVVLRGEAGYSEPGIQPGDVIFVLEQKPHKTFKRIQADLVIEKVCFFGILAAYREQANQASFSQLTRMQVLGVTFCFCIYTSLWINRACILHCPQVQYMFGVTNT